MITLTKDQNNRWKLHTTEDEMAVLAVIIRRANAERAKAGAPPLKTILSIQKLMDAKPELLDA